MEPTIFTYTGVYRDVCRRWYVEPDEIRKGGRNAYRSDVCFDTNVNNLGGGMFNKKGEVVTGFIVTAALIASIAGVGFYKTSQNGVLQNNGKKIWCKMQNKGENFCNDKYKFTPEGYHWEWGINNHKIPAYVPDEEV